MNNFYNSDGYVLIDLTGIDTTKQTQSVPGIYERIVRVIDTNKLVLLVNHEGLTPQAGIAHKRLNYYVINTTLYIYTINSNDIVMIEQAGTATVDVEIVPTLQDGVKIADYAVGDIEGSLYCPAQESEINDGVTASNTTWSSEKIAGQLADKADTSSLADVATTGAYSDLSGTPTIPVLTDLIDDSTTAVNKVWSSDKTAAEIAAGAGVTIDDTTTSLTKTWSSDKINSEVSAKPSIDDTTASTSTVYSSDKVDDLLSTKADTSTTYTKTEIDTALSGKQAKFLQYDELVTSDSSGFVSVTMSSPYIVVAVWQNTADTIIIPFASAGNNTDGNVKWWFKICNDNLQPRANYQERLHFLYIQ